jgi:nucleotide-binding universal stress UspA family protein
MYRSILVGIDGSPTASEALARASRLAQQWDAELHIVSAYTDPTFLTAVDPAAAAGLGTDGIEPALKEGADDLLRKGVEAAAGARVTTHAVNGEASDVLIDMAESLGCDLIIVGNRGMRGGKRILLGSVPNRVAHHAGCDVLIVHTT